MSEPETNPEVLAQLIDEWQERLRRGERPDVEEYARKYPALAEEIRQLLPGLAALENLKGDALDQTVAPTLSMPVAEGSPIFERLGDFRILREVGRGGMGVVYEAEQVSLGRRVALKVLPQKVILDSRQKRRFEREAKAAAKLHHTNIVPVFGVGEYEGMPYYVMQFIQGLGLDAVADEIKQMQKTPAQKPVDAHAQKSEDAHARTVTRHDISAADVARSLMTGEFHGAAKSEGDSEPTPNPAPTPSSATILGSGTFAASSSSVSIPVHAVGRDRAKRQTYWQSIASLGAQVADALEHAHSQGILHRDIKPSNLLLDTRGTVWVTDFGLAKAADHQDDITHTGDILGTLRYMPPEAFEGKSDARGDIYALGLTLYELLALRPAFGEKDRHLLIKQVTTTEPEPLGRLNPAIPRDLATIVQKTIDREPGRRYQTARELADDLERFLANEPIHARQTGPWERAVRWVRKKPAAAALVGVSAVASVAVAAAILVLLYNSRLQDAKMAADQARAEAEQARDAEVIQRKQAEDARLEAIRQQGEALKQRNIADAARAEAEKLRAEAETRGDETLLRRGLLAVDTQKWLEAIKDLGTYTKNHPNELRAWLGFAKAQSRVGRTQDAIAAYTRVIDIGKPDSDLNSLLEAYFARAEQQDRRGEKAKAIADFEKAFKLKPIDAAHAEPFARLLYEAWADWRVLEPMRLTTKFGTLRPFPDGSIIAEGAFQSESFTIETTAISGIRALRLEIIPSRNNEAEYDLNGKPLNNYYGYVDFTLSEITAAIEEPKKSFRPIAFDRAWSNYAYPYPGQFVGNEQLSTHPSSAIDGNPKTAWHVTGQNNPSLAAIFITSQPIVSAEAVKMKITLQFPTMGMRQNSMGRFRLSVSQKAPEPAYECALISAQITGWGKLALARYQRGEKAAALEALGQFDREGGNGAHTIAKGLVRSMILDQPERREEALGSYEKAIGQFKKNNYSNSYIQDQALSWLVVGASSQWVQREPEVLSHRRTRVETLVAMQQYPEAIEDYNHFIQLSKTDYRLYFDRGECYLRTRQLEKARADFASAGQLNAEETLAALQQKLTAFFNAQTQQSNASIEPGTALVYADAIVALDKGKPTEADSLARRGRILIQMDRKNDATADLVRALEINPTCAEALLERGAMRLQAGDKVLAIEDFIAARKSNPATALNWHTTRLNDRQLEYGNASSSAELALIHLGEMIECETQPQNRAESMARRSNLLRRLNRWAEAAADLTPAIELWPTTIHNLIERGECYSQAGDRTKALADISQALKVDRAQALPLIQQKLKHYDRNWQQVCVYLDACLTLKHTASDELAFLRQRAAARLELGEIAPALADCERIVLLKPDDVDAARIQSRCLLNQVEALQLKGKFADAVENRRKARESLEKMVKLQPDNDASALALGDLLLSQAANWQVLEPLRMKSALGATLTPQPDGSILASGTNTPMDTYLVGYRSTVTGIRAVRLEGIPDASLPRGGPGRYSNGSFMLAEITMRSSLTGKQPIALDRAVASAETSNNSMYHPVQNAIDGRRQTSWSVVEQPGQPRSIGLRQSAVFTLREPFSGTAEGVDFTFTLDLGSVGSTDRNLGRFRLAVSSSEHTMYAEQIRMSNANPFVKLAAARLLLGEREAALEILQRVEGKPKGLNLGDLLLIAWVREAISPGEPARAARDRFVASIKKKNDSSPLEMPSLACELLAKAMNENADNHMIALWLARTYDHLGDTSGAIALYDRAIEKMPPDVRETYLERGRLFLRISEWNKAAADFKKAVELKPEDHYMWFTTAPLILWSGDEDGYRRYCDAMLKQFGNDNDITISERSAKVSALVNTTPEMAKKLVELSQRAVGAKTGYACWYLYAHAMTNYRAGNLETAIEHARQAMDPQLPFNSHYVNAGARLIQALAHHKLGHAEDARRLLAEAEIILGRDLPDLEQTHPDDMLHDLLICHLLQKEATRLIAPDARPRAPAPREVLSFEVASDVKR